MKKLITAICFLLSSSIVFGQNIIDKHFSNYKNQENFTSVHVASKAFELSAYLELEEADEEFQEFKEFLTTVNAFDMIAGQGIESLDKKYQAALKKVESSHEELMSIDDKGGSARFMIDENGGIVKELIMLGKHEDKLVIFSLTGNMELRKISEMAKLMNEAAGGEFQKMLDSGLDEVSIYPNPLNRGDELQIKIPQELEEARISIRNINGALVKEMKLPVGSQKINTQELASGTYIIEMKNDKISIKRKLIIR